VFGPSKMFLITLGILGIKISDFGCDFEGNPRAKHAFKDLPQRWRCNWSARRPVTLSHRFNWLPLALGSPDKARILLFCVFGAWGMVM